MISAAPAALRQPDFRRLWLAGLASDAGDWMLLIALPIVVYDLTGSALGTSVAFLAELAPGVVLAPVAGRMADRFDRRRLLLAVTVLQGLGLLPLLMVPGRNSLALIYAVIVGQAALATLFDPAKNALLPTLVPTGELVSANSLIAINAGLGRLVGGPLGGLLLAAGSLHLIVLADALSFLVSALLIARLTSARQRPRAVRVTPVHNPAVGSPLRRPVVRAGLLAAFMTQMAQGIFVVAFILFVGQRLDGGAGEIGLLRGVQALGAVAAALGLGFARRPGPPGRLVAGACLAFGVISAMVWNAPSITTAPGLYVALFIAVGAPGVIMQAGLISGLQQAGHNGELGRISGAAVLAANAGQALGMIAAGVLTGPLGLMSILDAQAVTYLAAGVLAGRLLVSPGRRRPDPTRSRPWLEGRSDP